MIVGLVAAILVLVCAAPAIAMPGATVDVLAQGHNNGAPTGDPPDTTGAVGPSNYVQAVNGNLEVFNKSGGVLVATKHLNTLWASYAGTNAGNGCSTRNDGDPIVRYDQMADRWVIAQFSIPNPSAPSGPSFECVAVSTSGDPTKTYTRYDFSFPFPINDQVKIGVWPDAYYATFNAFGGPNGATYKGVDVCAWDRAAMIAGQLARQVCSLLAAPSNPPACPATQQFTPFGVLPANLDGAIPPPSASPEYLMQTDQSQCAGPYNQLDLWTARVDWSGTPSLTLGQRTPLNVAAFTPACSASSTNTCIPQPGSTTKIDALSERLMDRLVYRNFGNHESLVLNHTVTAGAGAGIRWYEIRDPGGTPTIFQQGTFAPNDTNWRWAGSIAQDQAGDIGLGYSVSSSAGSPGVAHPGIAWGGRLASDPLGNLGQAEAIIDIGAANAPDDYGTGRARWGDYSSMTIDPSDGCTFWYTNELYSVAGAMGWDTRVASFKFPNCGANDFSIAPSPGSVSAVVGGSKTTTITTTSTKGTAESVALHAWDLPAGASASFNPASITAGQSSTLTLTAGSLTPTGTYTVRVAGTAASAVHAATVTFTVDAGHTITVTKSASGSGTVTSQPAGIDCGATCSYGFAPAAQVTLHAAPSPGSVFVGFTAAGCAGTGDCMVTMDADKTVTAVFDRAPECTDLSGLRTPHNTALAIALSCADPDVADTIAYSVVDVPAHGTVSSVDAAGHVIYRPTTGYTGPDSFTVRASDNHGVQSNLATVSLAVGAPGPPVCAGLRVAVAHNTAKRITLACSHADPGEVLHWTILSRPAHGRLSPVTAGGRLAYTPKLGYTGVDSFTYRATDPLSQYSNIVRVTLVVGANHKPTCSAESLSVRHGSPARIRLRCKDVDPRDTLRWRVSSKPRHGRVGAIDRHGSLTYTPVAGFAGADSFSYVAVDSEGGRSAPAAVLLHVAAARHPR